jgi:hypothetical protein
MKQENKHEEIQQPQFNPPKKGRKLNIAQNVVRVFFLLLSLFLILYFLFSCSFSYKFEGGTINYDKTKTIHIQDFPNRATLVYPSLSQIFGQRLRDRYIEQTRLVSAENNADIEISGEITRYDIQGLAVKEDAYASQTRLTISVRVQYVNNKEPDQDVDQTFSAFREYPSDTMLDEVQDELCRQICEDLVDMIYNATVANW